MNDKPLFQSNALATLETAIKTFSTRGIEYGDSYRIDIHLTLKNILKKYNLDIPDRLLNAITAAVLIDVKYSRQVGPFKEDTLVDMIAYSAFLNEEIKQIDKELNG